MQEDLADDLEVVRDQLATETPNMSKLRKVQRNIGSFLSNLAQSITVGSEFISSITTLCQRLPKMMEGLVKFLVCKKNYNRFK